MKLKKTNIEDIFIVEPTVYEDNRGYFLESFNKRRFEEFFGKINFVQDNESKSVKGTLRGLHFQKPPFDQAKLVRCTQGKVLDVVVDVRKGSPSYGEHVRVELSEKNKRQLFIPRGFAHGFSVLSNSAVFSYKVDNFYAPKYDSGIRYNDEDLNIDWGLNKNELKLSEKDKNLPLFKDLNSYFNF